MKEIKYIILFVSLYFCLDFILFGVYSYSKIRKQYLLDESRIITCNFEIKSTYLCIEYIIQKKKRSYSVLFYNYFFSGNVEEHRMKL